MDIKSKTTLERDKESRFSIEKGVDGVWQIAGFPEAKQVLMGDNKQAGFKAETTDLMPSYMAKPVLFQDGPEHRDQRRQTAKYFTPTRVQNNYMALMEKYAEEIIGKLEKDGTADLNHMTAEMAMGVVAEVLGLTESSRMGMARRLDTLLHSDLDISLSLQGLPRYLNMQWITMNFYFRDVLPAIRTRKAQPQEDLISHLLEKGYRGSEILAECITYGTAGMVTTQEFICIAAWHMLENSDLRREFLGADQDRRYRILNELLRLEPVVGHLFRRLEDEMAFCLQDGQEITLSAGERVDLNVVSANLDERAAGACPLAFDPDRKLEKGVTPAVLSFGAGPHRCAGEHIAIAESDIFLRRLLSIESLRIQQPPTVSRNELIKGYELRRFIVSV